MKKCFFSSKKNSLMVFDGELKGKHFRANGGLNAKVDLGVLQMSRMRRFWDALRSGGIPIPGGMLVTDAGVAFMVDDWDGDSLNISDLNFHDSGIGIVAASVTDTALGTASGPTTRATGTKSQPSANIIRSVGTISYTSTFAITEWGLFNTASRATVNMWDRKVFGAINVNTGDSIQFTYSLTVTSGG